MGKKKKHYLTRKEKKELVKKVNPTHPATRLQKLFMRKNSITYKKGILKADALIKIYIYKMNNLNFKKFIPKEPDFGIFKIKPTNDKPKTILRKKIEINNCNFQTGDG